MIRTPRPRPVPSHRRLLLAGLVIASFGVSNRNWGAPIPANAAEAQAGAQAGAKAGTGQETEECRRHFQEVVAVYRSLPGEFRSMSSQEATALTARLEKALLGCQAYLRASPDGPHAAEVHYYTARFLYLMSRRFETQVRKEVASRGGTFDLEAYRDQVARYNATIAAHARKASDALPKESALSALSLQLLGLGYYGARDYGPARDAFTRFLELHPDHEEVGAVLSSLGRAYLNLEEFDRGIATVRSQMRREPIYRSRSYPFIVEVLWKLNEAKGDLDGMLQTVEAVRTVHPLRLRTERLPASTREDYERYLIFNGFRRGYVLFARGEIDAARAAFQEHVDTLDRKEKQAEAAGGASAQKSGLPPYADIYRKRSRDCARFIDELARRPPPVDLDLGDLWITDKRVSFGASAGKVVGVVMRSVGDQRSAAFLEPLAEFCATRPDIELVTLSYLKGTTNVSQQIDRLRQELAELSYVGAAGFDPDAARKGLFRSLHANIGSATFVAVDRAGDLVWFQQDPRGVDVRLARSILTRLEEGR